MRLAVISLVVMLSSGNSWAQEMGRPWAFLSPEATLTTAPGGPPPLDLRSNVTQNLYLYVVNPTEDTPMLVLEVKAGAILIGNSEIKATTGQNQPVKVTLKPAQAPAPVLGAPATAGIELPPSMQFTVSVNNKNKSDEKANESLQTVKLRNPATLLSNTTATYYGTDNKLVVRVAASDLQGPPCPVELAIGPNDVPGLVRDELKGVVRGTLSPEQREVNLHAAGLVGALGEGMFALNVDNVERAVLYRGNFKVAPDKDSGPFVRVVETGLRVDAPPVGRPGQEMAARVSTFNAPDNARLTMTFGQGESQGRVVAQTYSHPSPRVQRVSSIVAPEGHLAVTTVMRVWAPNLDTRGIYGPCLLVATMAIGNEVTEAKTTIVLDDTPPKGDFDVPAGRPVSLERGQTLNMRVIAEDPDSGIKKVEFFVNVEPAPAGPDGKFPAEPKPIVADAVPSEVRNAAPKFFTAKTQVPESKLPVPIWTRITNGVDLTTVKKMEVALVDPPAPIGSIRGQIFHGTLLQKNLTVTLYNMKWEPLKTAKLDDDGNFEFMDLTPGEYRLGCEHAPRKLKGYGTITVKAGKTPTPTTIEIKR